MLLIFRVQKLVHEVFQRLPLIHFTSKINLFLFLYFLWGIALQFINNLCQIDLWSVHLRVHLFLDKWWLIINFVCFSILSPSLVYSVLLVLAINWMIEDFVRQLVSFALFRLNAFIFISTFISFILGLFSQLQRTRNYVLLRLFCWEGLARFVFYYGTRFLAVLVEVRQVTVLIIIWVLLVYVYDFLGNGISLTYVERIYPTMLGLESVFYWRARQKICRHWAHSYVGFVHLTLGSAHRFHHVLVLGYVVSVSLVWKSLNVLLWLLHMLEYDFGFNFHLFLIALHRPRTKSQRPIFLSNFYSIWIPWPSSASKALIHSLPVDFLYITIRIQHIWCLNLIWFDSYCFLIVEFDKVVQMLLATPLNL